MPHLDNKFPNKQQRVRLETNQRNLRLYDGRHYKVFGIKDYFVDDTRKERKLYIATNLPALITEYFADLIMGQGAMFFIEGEKESEALSKIVRGNKLNDTLYQESLDQSTFGYGVLRVRSDVNDPTKPIIELVQTDSYYPEYDFRDTTQPSRVTLASFIKDPRGEQKRGLIYKTIYEKDGEKITLRFELRFLNSDSTQGEEVDPVKYSQYFPELTEEPLTIEGTTRIPVWQIDNTRRAGDPFGKSDYKDIEPQLEEVNNRVTHISIQLIKHMNARMAVPPSTLPDGKKDKIKVKDIDLIEVAKEDHMPAYITNSNPLIEECFKFIDMEIQQALGIAKVPPEMVRPESSSGNDKVEAMRLRLFPSLRKVARKRLAFESVLQEALTFALSIAGVETENEIRIVWDDVLPVDMVALTLQMVERSTAGLVSKRTAISTLDDLTDEQADQELERIRQEEPAIEPFLPIVS